MIYFAKTKGSNFVKIGYEKENVEKRVESFQTGCPEELSIILVEHGDRKDEAELHRIFRDSHFRGEWFSFSSDLQEYVEESHLAREYVRKAFAIKLETKNRDRFQEEMFDKHMEGQWQAKTESQG